MLSRKWLLAIPVGALMVFSLALAQDPGRGGPGPGAGAAPGPGQPPAFGGFDPAQWRERMSKMMQDQLGASDDEWKVLYPKIEKVQTTQRESFGGFGMMGFGRRPGGGPGGPGGGPGGPGGMGNQQLSKVAQAQTDLRALLDKKDAGATDIAGKLAAYREAREKARTEVQAAQKSLKELVTQRQEAVLVLMGVLE
ncbi:MAG: hypothetical protein KA354_06970 [Phycisphaerae bacterium]|nr:hypothetical protein [Phycisphaerae bacterium]